MTEGDNNKDEKKKEHHEAADKKKEHDEKKKKSDDEKKKKSDDEEAKKPDNVVHRTLKKSVNTIGQGVNTIGKGVLKVGEFLHLAESNKKQDGSKKERAKKKSSKKSHDDQGVPKGRCATEGGLHQRKENHKHRKEKSSSIREKKPPGSVREKKPPSSVKEQKTKESKSSSPPDSAQPASKVGDDGEAAAVAPKYKIGDQKAVEQAETWAQRTLKKGVNGLFEEFLTLKPYMPENASTTAYKANPDKNRYPDVWCEDKSRVVLKYPAGRTNDYIHANYIATPNYRRRLICTQGPLPNTTADFWHMIIQEECEYIIMLCNVEENGMPKCAQYWPINEGQAMSVDQVEILNLKIEQPPPNTEETSIRRTTLELKYMHGGKQHTRKVRHFHWTNWPDRGVPITSLTAMVLLSCVRGSRRPIAIHCAAGIGRTGTIAAIEYIVERFTDGQNCDEMVDIVKRLRQQRLSSIQNNQQYLYVHRVLLMYFIDKYKLVAGHPEFQHLYDQFKRDYDQLVCDKK